MVYLFGMMFLSALLETAGIGLVLPFLTVISDPEIIETNRWLLKLFLLLDAENKTEFLIFLSVIIVIVYLIKNIFLQGLYYLQSRFVFSKRSSLGKRIFITYLKRSYSYHLEHNTAELDRNIRFEVPKVYSYVQSFLKISTELSVLICIVSMLLWVNTLIVVCGVIIFGSISAVFYKVFHSYIKVLAKRVQDSQLHTGQALLEGFGAIKEVKISGKEDYFPNRYYSNMMVNARANWQQQTLSASPKFFLEVTAVTSLIAIVIVYLNVQQGSFNNLIPTLGIFAVAVIRLVPIFGQLVTLFHQLSFSAVGIDVVYEDVKGLEEEQKHWIVKENKIMSFDQQIKIQDVSFSFGNARKFGLKRVSLEISKGQSIALVGPSGAGKTTLVNIIMGLLKPSQGLILADDNDILENPFAWQRNIGYVPQSIYLLDSSIRENVAFGLETKDIDESMVWNALIIAQADDIAKQLPRGLDTLVGENGVRLSGGQRQRLGIARALYHQPEILILDEATSDLDNETEKEVSLAINQISGHKTLIIIAHRLSSIQKCDCIYFMKNGSIVDLGAFKELMSKNSDFKRMVKTGKI